MRPAIKPAAMFWGVFQNWKRNAGNRRPGGNVDEQEKVAAAAEFLATMLNKPGFREWLEGTDFSHMVKPADRETD